MGKSAGRYLGGLMAAVLVLGMTGCGQSEEKSNGYERGCQ